MMRMNNKQEAFSTVWNKYLPAIRILVKKAAATEQVLGMNRTDFESAAGIKKSGYRFTIKFVKDKPGALYSGNDIVQAFISVLLTDEVIRAQLLESNYTFSFSSKYQLLIKNNSLPAHQKLPAAKEEEVLVN